MIGGANKGKTTFVKGLTNKKGSKPLSQSDKLFEIDEWTYSPSSNASPVTFIIWDFSGKVCI